jgi:6-phosphogluconolactonase (cycloisomerase 2 family)
MLFSKSAQLALANARIAASLIFIAALVTACGGGSGSSYTPPPTTPTPTPTPSTYTIGGTVSGLTGSGLVLADNGGDNLTVAANATSFTFATPLAAGAAYAVTVATQPTGQTCTVAGGSGTVASSNVTTVAVTCASGTFTVGGTISGLTGSGLVLQDNGGDNLTVAANATTFTFATPVATGAPYAVTVLTQPTGQTCTVSAGAGTMGSSSVTSVAIACAAAGPATVTVGGTIRGLTTSGLVLQNNAGDNLTVAANATTFTFATALASGAAYAVTILTQPTGQTCTVSAGTGTATANVANVAVFCKGVGRFVFVVNGGDDAIQAFAINPTTGALTPAGTAVTAEIAPSSIAVDQTGQYVYVANRSSMTVNRYTVDPTTGALTAVPGDIATANTGGASIAITPSNQYLYVGGFGSATAGSVAGFGLDATSGALTALPFLNVASGNWASAMAIDPTGQFLFATAQQEQHLFVFNIATTGSLTMTGQTTSGPFSTGAAPAAVAVYPLGGPSGGYVYTADSGANRIGMFSYDNTGTLAIVGNGDLNAKAAQPRALAVDPLGKFLYVANYMDGTVSTFSIDPTTGILTFQAQVDTGNLNKVANPGPIDLKLDPSGQFLFVANKLDGSVSVFTAAAGVLTLAGTVLSGSDTDASAAPAALAVE